MDQGARKKTKKRLADLANEGAGRKKRWVLERRGRGVSDAERSERERAKI